MAKKELFSDVDELVSSLNKELGEGSIMNFGDDKPIISIPRESTGSLVVDKGLGGGWAVYASMSWSGWNLVARP